MSLSGALSQQRIAFQIVLLGGGCGPYLGDIVLEVAEVGHDLRDTYSTGIVN